MGTYVSLSKHSERIAVVTLDRPEAANALSLQLLEELNVVLDELGTNPLLSCLVLTGSGEKAFCAGADLKERRGMTDEQVIETVRLIGATASKIASLKMPTIAAVNGAAFGGGLEFALACDLRVLANHAKVGLTETALAIIPGAGGTQRLTRLVGLGKAKQLIYTAKAVDAREALEIGLAEAVGDSAIETAIQIAEKIAQNGPLALRLAKQAIDEGFGRELEQGLHIEHMCYQETLHTEDRIEGLNAFKEKRKPAYKGK